MAHEICTYMAYIHRGSIRNMEVIPIALASEGRKFILCRSGFHLECQCVLKQI